VAKELTKADLKKKLAEISKDLHQVSKALHAIREPDHADACKELAEIVLSQANFIR
jgi:hypothetical protein